MCGCAKLLIHRTMLESLLATTSMQTDDDKRRETHNRDGSGGADDAGRSIQALADGAGERQTPVGATRRALGGFLGRLRDMTDRERAALCVASPAVLFASCVRIYDKAGELVRPTPNILQIRISAAVEAFQGMGIPLRLVIVKPRQVGCSTFVAFCLLWLCRRRRINGLIMADKSGNAAGLVQRVTEYHTHDVFPWGVSLRASKDALEFGNGSLVGIDTAENPRAGISKTRQAAHLSEVGEWSKTTVKNDKVVMKKVLPSVGKKGPTIVVAEGTPSGAGGWHYETYGGACTLEQAIEALAAGKPIPGNGWIKVWAGWWEFEEHRVHVSADTVRIMRDTLTDREREGIQRWGWDWEQVAWRRKTMAEECGGDEDDFDEAYMQDDVRCWLVSGRPRFQAAGLSAIERHGKSMPRPDLVKLTDIGDRMVGVSRVGTVGEADAMVWEWPMVGCAYLISVDPATGEEQAGGKDPDSHSILVWRRGYRDDKGAVHPHMLVARIVPGCRWAVPLAAEATMNLSRLYGDALVVLEVNMGLGFLELFRRMGVPLYVREVLDPSNPNREKPREMLGWKLGDQNDRERVIEALASAIRQGDLDVRCPHWLSECRTFVRTASGKAEARPGCHDDDVMSSGMGIYCLPSASIMREGVRKRPKPKDWDRWRPVGGSPRRGRAIRVL